MRIKMDHSQRITQIGGLRAPLCMLAGINAYDTALEASSNMSFGQQQTTTCCGYC